MWFEILPSFTICVVALYLPGQLLYYMQDKVLGTPYKRTMIERWDRQNYQRDERLTGNAYKVNGLETVPDN